VAALWRWLAAKHRERSCLHLFVGMPVLPVRGGTLVALPEGASTTTLVSASARDLEALAGTQDQQQQQQQQQQASGQQQASEQQQQQHASEQHAALGTSSSGGGPQQERALLMHALSTLGLHFVDHLTFGGGEGDDGSGGLPCR